MSHPILPKRIQMNRLVLALILNGGIVLAEFIGGYLIQSVGLMTDAWHNLIDQGGLFLSLYAHIMASKPPTESRTFGYHRAGIVVAFINALVLIIVSIGLAYLAVLRLAAPVQVPGGWMIAIALFGFASNLGIALLLKKDAEKDLNMRGAFWHMMGDAWVSFGVAASGVGIIFTKWSILDPVIGLVIVGVIVRGAWPVFKESLDVLLEAAPPEVRASGIVETIGKIKGVINVHDFHLWTLKPGLAMLTCHVLMGKEEEARSHDLLQSIQKRVESECGIHHLTVQLETECDHPECEHPDSLHCDLKESGQ